MLFATHKGLVRGVEKYPWEKLFGPGADSLNLDNSLGGELPGLLDDALTACTLVLVEKRLTVLIAEHCVCTTAFVQQFLC